MKKSDEIAFFKAAKAAAAGSPTGRQPGRQVLMEAAAGLGIHPKRAEAFIRKWDRNGWWNYGVNLWAGWFEDTAPAELEP